MLRLALALAPALACANPPAEVSVAAPGTAVDATFDDADHHALAVQFRYGVTAVDSGLSIQLFDTPVGCDYPRPKEAARLSFDVPEPPGGVTTPITVDTYVSARVPGGTVSFNAQHATVTIESFSREPGGHIRGSLAFRSGDPFGKPDEKSSGGGTFDVELCPASRFDNPADLVILDPAALERPAVTGELGGAPFASAGAIVFVDTDAYDEVMGITFYPQPVTCASAAEVEGASAQWVALSDVGVSELENGSGEGRPALVAVGNHSFLASYTKGPRAWVRLDRVAWPPRDRIGGAVVIASPTGFDVAQSATIGGHFDALVCPAFR